MDWFASAPLPLGNVTFVMRAWRPPQRDLLPLRLFCGRPGCYDRSAENCDRARNARDCVVFDMAVSCWARSSLKA